MTPLFGTDGIRGRANDGALTPENLVRLGRILARVLRDGSSGGDAPPRVAIARDTRRSGPLIRDAFSAGLLAGGVDVLDAGVFTTPALATIVSHVGAALGVVVSASHNPADDNGIKLLGADGEKVPVEIERAVEAAYAAGGGGAEKDGPIGRSSAIPSPARLYETALADSRFDDLRLDGLKIAVDAANGAAHALGPAVFRRFGVASVARLACRPDGDNINARCGALHPERIARATARRGADLGVALDGDGDRAIFADASGAVHDGDAVLWMTARALREGFLGRALRGDLVVGTVMSNGGLESSLARIGVRLHRTPVGDRNVLAAMRETGAAIGGEPSGHVIFDDGGPLIGDGLVTALKIAEMMKRSGTSLATLAAGLEKFAQVILNVRVAGRPAVENVPALRDGLAAARRDLGPSARILLRYSGTEPLLRVMVEGREASAVRAVAEALAKAAKTALSG
jgi:phosphoglucosamine mutase